MTIMDSQKHSFDQIIDSLPSDPNAKGAEFEKLCIWFLQNSPEDRISQLEAIPEWSWN